MSAAPASSSVSASAASAPTELVIHADDVGMCHGANTAFVELSHAGTITSGSVMVPCPWFPEIAELAAADASLDVGVHLTLNAEKPHYRWRPVSNASRSSGLIDNDGYLWHTVSQVRAHANPDAVEEEWRAQVDRALSAGIDVTHFDAHMGSALAPEWCERFVALGVEYGAPIVITATLAGYAPNNHVAGVDEAAFAPFVEAASAAGLPVFDQVLETNFGRPAGNSVDYRSLLGTVAGDLSFCAFHPNAPGEVEVIEPDTSHVRTDEYELFGTPTWKSWLDAQPFTLVSMRELRTRFRSRAER
jgi:chitin disaccharide deacetylase